jgi:hypothetical protein
MPHIVPTHKQAISVAVGTLCAVAAFAVLGGLTNPFTGAKVAHTQNLTPTPGPVVAATCPPGTTETADACERVVLSPAPVDPESSGVESVSNRGSQPTAVTPVAAAPTTAAPVESSEPSHAPRSEPTQQATHEAPDPATGGREPEHSESPEPHDPSGD